VGELDPSAIAFSADEAQRMQVLPDRVFHPVWFHCPTLSRTPTTVCVVAPKVHGSQDATVHTTVRGIC